MLPEDPYKIRLSGRGGQGMILAGVLLSEAGMLDGLDVVQTQTYGPQARLGASKSEVILSSKEIANPEVDIPDLLLCLSRDAYVKYGKELASGGLRVVDESVSREEEVEDALLLPILETAEKLGDPIVANMVAVGALLALKPVVSHESLLKAMELRVKSHFLDLNKKAFEEGLELGKKLVNS